MAEQGLRRIWNGAQFWSQGVGLSVTMRWGPHEIRWLRNSRPSHIMGADMAKTGEFPSRRQHSTVGMGTSARHCILRQRVLLLGSSRVTTYAALQLLWNSSFLSVNTLLFTKLRVSVLEPLLLRVNHWLSCLHGFLHGQEQYQEYDRCSLLHSAKTNIYANKEKYMNAINDGFVQRC